MLEILLNNKVELLFGCGIVNLMLAFFVIVIKYHSVRKKLALLKIQLSTAMYTIGVSLSFRYDGLPGTTAHWMNIISNLCVYVSLLLTLIFVSDYSIALFMESGKFDKLPKRLLLGRIIPSVGLLPVIINLFTGIYYSIDAQNVYHRGPLFLMAFAFPLVSGLIMFSFAIQYRHMINKSLVFSLIFFSCLPMVAGVAQIFIYGFPLIELSGFIGAVTIFWFALSDQNDEMSSAASKDLQTGLANTYGYLHEVDKIIVLKNINDYTAFYFDMVRMSYINNKLGKKGGDEVIAKYAAKIGNTFESDEILGRLGGNFFVALVKNVNVEKFLKLLDDCEVDVDYHGVGETLHIKAVAGAYKIDKKKLESKKQLNASQIISNTATALTYAKNVVHKPVVYLDEELQKEFDHIREVENLAVKGLRAGEFEPFYQPKVNSNDNTLCGAEALCRWRHEGKLIPPNQFIGIMEKNGSICDLDFFILERVCQDIKKWLADGIEPVPVSVNFSRKNLSNPILAEVISKVVEKYEIPKKYIQIEVTETIDEFPMSYLTGVVEALQRYGLTVAIDDFGTGSSSIKLLQEVKFDVLKIDKTFVDYKTEQDRLIIGDIITMAKHRDIDVIAEGVEDKDRVEALREMGCYAIQGYVFDKPLDKAEFDKRLLNKAYKH